MPSHHEPLAAMGPVDWEDVPQDNMDEFLAEVFSETQTIVESIPVPATQATAGTAGRARSKTESAVSAGDIQRAVSVSQRQTATSVAHAQDLRKEWKEAKVNPRENPLGINVYKLAAKDGRGSWFARRSVHEGLSFDNWKKGLEIEFPETMKVQGSPGSGNIRGIGADKRVEHLSLDNSGSQLQVFQLSAQFPGPTAPRDFVTLLLTAETSVTPTGLSRPLRQFMIVSKPCQHAECPPRQGIIRGYYESVEVIREVPMETPSAKRSRSSTDLLMDDTKNRMSVVGGSEGASPEDDANIGIEWLMVTRSDPGGSVPRFLIEKGTPPGIVGDANKFLKWVTSQAAQGFSKPSDADPATTDTDSVQQTETNPNDVPALPPRRASHQLQPHSQVTSDDDDVVPSSNGLYGIIAGAIGAAGSIASGLLGQFGSYSETGSNESSFTSDNAATNKIPEDDESDISDVSSVRSFASALERSVTEEKSPDSIAESVSDTSKSNPPSTQQEKELKKLQERRRKLDEKVAKLQERRNNRLQGDKEKDAATIAKLREKHEREVAKQEEKYKREVRKLEERREQEQRKAEEKRRKALEREEKSNMSLELEKTRAERDLARKQLEILEVQVGELQAQNTTLVRKLGKMGLLEREDSVSSLKSLRRGADSANTSTATATAATTGA